MNDGDEGQGLLHNNVTFPVCIMSILKRLDLSLVQSNSWWKSLRKENAYLAKAFRWRKLLAKPEETSVAPGITLSSIWPINFVSISSEGSSNSPAIRKYESDRSSNAPGILVFIYILCFASQLFLDKIRIASCVSVMSLFIIFHLVATKSTPLTLTFAARVEIFVFFWILVF